MKNTDLGQEGSGKNDVLHSADGDSHSRATEESGVKSDTGGLLSQVASLKNEQFQDKEMSKVYSIGDFSKEQTKIVQLKMEKKDLRLYLINYKSYLLEKRQIDLSPDNICMYKRRRDVSETQRVYVPCIKYIDTRSLTPVK